MSTKKEKNFVEKRKKSPRRVNKAREEELSPHSKKEKPPLSLYLHRTLYSRSELPRWPNLSANYTSWKAVSRHSLHVISIWYTTYFSVVYLLYVEGTKLYMWIDTYSGVIIWWTIRRSDVTSVIRNLICGPRALLLKTKCSDKYLSPQEVVRLAQTVWMLRQASDRANWQCPRKIITMPRVLGWE